MQLSGVHHIAVICSDYERSKKFYVQILGLKVIRENYRETRNSYKLDLDVGDGTQIELFSFPNPPARVSRPEACGLRHLAFAVKNLDSTITHLKSNGVEVDPCEPMSSPERDFLSLQIQTDCRFEIYET